MADLMQQARELLARAYYEIGEPICADMTRSGRHEHRAAIRAIAAALRAAPDALAERHAAAERDACRWARIAEEQKQRADALEARLRAAPEGFVLVPVELALRVEDSLGRFVSDEGWGSDDMGVADDLSGLLAARPQGVKDGR